MKKLLLTLSALLLALSTLAAGAPSFKDVQTAPQDTQSFFRRMDQRRYAKLLRSNLDSSYVGIPHQRWTLRTSSNFGWNTLKLDNLSSEGIGYRASLSSAFDIGQGFYLSWRGITLGASLKPAWFIPKLRNRDQKYTISVYGNRMGMSATIRSTTTLRGDYMSLPDSTVIKIPLGNAYDFSADFDAYYVFNSRRFSMPAAFTQSKIQKRSAGSALASVSIRNGITWVGAIDNLGNQEFRVLTNMFSLGGGYGHNFITPHNWLLHASLVTNISVLQYNRVLIGDDSKKIKNTFPDNVSVLQLSALHWKGNMFFGTSFTARAATYGNKERIEFINANMDLRFFLGVRL